MTKRIEDIKIGSKFRMSEDLEIYIFYLWKFFIDDKYDNIVNDLSIITGDTDYLLIFNLYTGVTPRDKFESFLEHIREYVQMVDGYSQYSNSEPAIKIAIRKNLVFEKMKLYKNFYNSSKCVTKFNL